MTGGLKSLIVRWDNQEVGKLGLNPQNLCVFRYSDVFINHGVSISPFELPLKPEIFTAKPTPFYGGFGVFDDSLPDGWGLLIQDRYLQSKGINPNSFNLLDRLALVGRGGRGALEFIPDYSITSNSDFVDFEKLSRESAEIIRDSNYMGEGVEELQKRGGSPGGARPKIFVHQDNKEWLVKFRAYNDPEDIGVQEYKYSLLAKKCGVEMPETRLFEGKYFGVERFDRKNNKKIHTVSVAGLIRADYRLPSIDYAHIFKIANMLTHNQKELWKVFRLMTFNYLIGNKDDHAKNFSFILENQEWRFAPAYDLLPGGGFNGYRTTSINDKIDPGKEDLISVALKAGLPKKESLEIYDHMKEIIQC